MKLIAVLLFLFPVLASSVCAEDHEVIRLWPDSAPPNPRPPKRAKPRGRKASSRSQAAQGVSRRERALAGDGGGEDGDGNGSSSSFPHGCSNNASNSNHLCVYLTATATT